MGFPLGVLSMAIEKIWVFHEQPIVNSMGFRSMAMLLRGKAMDMTMGFPGLTMDFE